MITTQRLMSELEKVSSILGVSIGKLKDKSTWRIDFAPEATAEQKALARQVVDTFSPGTVEDLQPKGRNMSEEFDRLKAENAALKKALIKKGTLTDAEITAERQP